MMTVTQMIFNKGVFYMQSTKNDERIQTEKYEKIHLCQPHAYPVLGLTETLSRTNSLSLYYTPHRTPHRTLFLTFPYL